MKAEEFGAIMAAYAESDQRATASLIELLVATVMRKHEPAAGEVQHVTISPADIEETLRTHYFETDYDGDSMRLSITPYVVPNGDTSAD